MYVFPISNTLGAGKSCVVLISTIPKAEKNARHTLEMFLLS